jgi:hypothetical protein
VIASTAWQAWSSPAGSKIGKESDYAAEVHKLAVLDVVPGRVERLGIYADVPADLTGELGPDPGFERLILTDRDQFHGNGPLPRTLTLAAHARSCWLQDHQCPEVLA